MKVSVVIPVYNRVFELQRAINSVLQQTEQDFEILVVDDFSENDLKTIIDSLNDTRIRYYRLEKKGNANICRNLGVDNAQGEYIAMLDSDDEWLPNHLELKIKALIELGADGLFGSCKRDNGEVLLDMVSRPFKSDELMVNYLLSDGWAPTPTHFYKAECAKNIRWDEELIRHQDWDFSVRFAAQYIFLPTYDLTCIVYWTKGERRNEHFDSLITFINRNKKDISPTNYYKYHKGFYEYLINKPDAEQKYLKHYKTESLRFIDLVNLRDYMSMFANGKGALYRLYLRFEFVLKVLFK